MNTPNATAAEAEVPFSRILVLSVLVAAPWAALGFLRGVTWSEYVALFAGCAFSLLLVQLTATALREVPSFGPRVLTPLALAAPVMGYAAFWLMRNTHHRPLGAVTWAVFAAVAWLAAAALLSPLRIPARLAAGIAVLAALVLAWPVWTGAFGVGLIAELGAGVLLSALSIKLLLRKEFHWKSAALPGVAAALLIGATLFAFSAGVGAAAAEKAPLLAGVVGLLA